MSLNKRDNFRIKNPVEQIVLVLEMIIEALAVHVAALADVRHLNFVKGNFLHEFPHCACQRPFCDIGISHDVPPFLSLAQNPKVFK